jgi:hypothetical protein
MRVCHCDPEQPHPCGRRKRRLQGGFERFGDRAVSAESAWSPSSARGPCGVVAGARDGHVIAVEGAEHNDPVLVHGPALLEAVTTAADAIARAAGTPSPETNALASLVLCAPLRGRRP